MTSKKFTRAVNKKIRLNDFLEERGMYIPFKNLGKKHSWKHIAAGGFGIVYKAKYKGKNVAVKQLQINSYSGTEHMIDEVKKEIILMQKISGLSDVFPIIYGALQRGRNIYMVMELAKGKELYDYFEDDYLFKALSQQQKYNIICKLLKALKILHQNGVVHSDIKLENIMYDRKTNTVKLMDYGLSCAFRITQWAKNLSDYYQTRCMRDRQRGTPLYFSPELIESDYISNDKFKSNDVWGLGIVAFMLIMGYYPFDDETEDVVTLLKSIRNGDVDKIHFEQDITKNTQNMIRDMLNKNYTKRKTTTQLINTYCKSSSNKVITRKQITAIRNTSLRRRA